jgi:hypothetical protein
MNEHNPEFQRGNDSNLTSMERLNQHQIWLQKQHQEVKNKILQRNKSNEESEPVLVQGFPKD